MAKQKQPVSETEKPVRTRTLGELRWFEVIVDERDAPVPTEVLHPIGGPAFGFADAAEADAWLKSVLAEEILTPGVLELHRVVKRVEPRRVEVLRFEW